MRVLARLCVTVTAALACAIAVPAAEAPAAEAAAANAVPQAPAEGESVEAADDAAAAESSSTDARRKSNDEVPAPEGAEQQEDPAKLQIQEAIRVFQQEADRLGARIDPDAPADGKRRRRNAAQAAAWHGRVYEYIRNNAFDATPHEIVQNGGQSNLLRRNQFGFSVSGPVVIPKLYDGRSSTFFTFSYEGTRESRGRSYLRTLPTAQQRTGDFSDLVNKAGQPLVIYDPATTAANPGYDASRGVSEDNLEYNRDPFPNNQIPLSRLDRVATAVNQAYPLPNTNIGPFLQNNFWSNPFEQNQPDGVLAKVDHNLFERHKLTVDLAYSKGFQGRPRIYDTDGNPGNPDLDFVDRRLTVGETYAISPSTVYTVRGRASSNVVQTQGLDDGRDLPAELGLTGVSGDIYPAFRIDGVYGIGPGDGAYLSNAVNTYSLDNQLTVQRGDHSWSFRSDLNHYQVNSLELDQPSGRFDFNDSLTGLPGVTNTGAGYASFLLGMAAQAVTTDQVQPVYLRRSFWSSSVRDEIQIADNLTATLGVQVDVTTPRVEKYDRQSTLDPDALNPENGLPGALIFAGVDGQGRAFRPTRTTIEPTLGVAWSPTAKRNTVVRATFRHYYSSLPIRSGSFGAQGYNRIRTSLSPNRQLAPAVTLEDGFPEADRELPDLRADAANGGDVDYIPQNGLLPTYDYFGATLERRLPYGMTVRAQRLSYRGSNLLMGGSVAGVNRIPLEALGYQDALNDESFRRTLRPFPQYQDVEGDGRIPGGRYEMDLNTVSIEKRTGQGLSFDASYQYRDQWDDYSGPGIQNPFDRSTAWSRARGVRPHRFEFNYVYELPIGPGKALFNRQGVLAKVLGDWSLSGFTRWLSGDPLVLTPQFNNTGGVIPDGALRVNEVAGVDAAVESPGPGMWFNPLAFSDPADFTIGNAPRTHPSLLNPSWQNHDIAITKRVPISSEKSLELLIQSFNFINRANWNDPDTEIGPDDARNVNAGKIIGSTGGRVLQLGMRYNF